MDHFVERSLPRSVLAPRSSSDGTVLPAAKLVPADNTDQGAAADCQQPLALSTLAMVDPASPAGTAQAVVPFLTPTLTVAIDQAVVKGL